MIQIFMYKQMQIIKANRTPANKQFKQDRDSFFNESGKNLKSVIDFMVKASKKSKKVLVPLDQDQVKLLKIGILPVL